MATENRLRAKVPPSHAQYITEIADEEFDGSETEAERAVVKEGLGGFGYDVDRPETDAGLWLYYIRFIGQALGLSGLAALALGVFWGQMAGIYGIGLLIIGFLIVAVVDALDRYGGILEGPTGRK